MKHILICLAIFGISLQAQAEARKIGEGYCEMESLPEVKAAIVGKIQGIFQAHGAQFPEGVELKGLIESNPKTGSVPPGYIEKGNQFSSTVVVTYRLKKNISAAIPVKDRVLALKATLEGELGPEDGQFKCFESSFADRVFRSAIIH